MPATLGDRMISQMSARGFILLQTVGRLADEMGLSAYAVGGFVRDLLMSKTSADIDVVVEGDGIAFAKLVGRELDGTVQAHHAFGTATITLPDELTLDVATARSETYAQPAALPQVVSGSIMQDLFRRDFTVNAMAIRLNARRFGELVDLFGGQRDVQARRLRTLHAKSFLDDPTRIFRAVRLEARLGFRMDGETLRHCVEAGRQDLPGHLSGQRLCNELRLILLEAQPEKALARLGVLKLLRFVHPKLIWTSGMARRFETVRAAVDRCRKMETGGPHNLWLVYFMALVEGLTPNAVQDMMQRLALPARDVGQVMAGHGRAATILRGLAKRPAPKPSAIYRALDGLADETVCLLIARASSEAVRKRLLDYRSQYRDVKLSVTGADLKALGLTPGPAYKKILTRLLDARLDGVVRSKADELKLVAKLARL